MSYILSIIVCATFLLSGTDVLAQKKSQKDRDPVSIETRLSKNLPVFTPPNCAEYLIEFGSNDKAVKSAANSIDIDYFSKLPIQQIDGAYMLIYADPKNIRGKNGSEITNTIFYIFSFLPNGEYFSFSSNMVFETIIQAKEAYDYFVKMIEVDDTNSENSVSNIVSCDDKRSPLRGDNRLITIRRDGLSVTFIVIDHDMIQNYIKSSGS
jgi:hypothetical protein